MIVLLSEGAEALLDVWTDTVGYTYHLYCNELSPSDVINRTSFVEATFPGYKPQPAKGWTNAATVEGCTSSSADPILWSCAADTDPQDVWGYFVTMGLTGPLLFWEPRDTGPVRIAAKGDPVELFPRLTCRQDFSPC